MSMAGLYDQAVDVWFGDIFRVDPPPNNVFVQVVFVHETQCRNSKPCSGTCPTGVCPLQGCLPGHSLATAQINKTAFRTGCGGTLRVVVTSAVQPYGFKVCVVDSDALLRLGHGERTREEIEECVQSEQGDKVPSLEFGAEIGQFVIVDGSYFRAGQDGQYSASLQNLKFKLIDNMGPKKNWALLGVLLGPGNEELTYCLSNSFQIYDNRSSKALKAEVQDVNTTTPIAKIPKFGAEGQSFARDPEPFLTEHGYGWEDVALFSPVKNPRDAGGLERFVEVFDEWVRRVRTRVPSREQLQAILTKSPKNDLRQPLSNMKRPDGLLRLCSLTIGEHKWHVAFTQFFPTADFVSATPIALALEVGPKVYLRSWSGWGHSPAQKKHIISKASEEFCQPDHAGLWRTTAILSEGGQLFALAQSLGHVFHNCFELDLGVFNSLIHAAPGPEAQAWIASLL